VCELKALVATLFALPLSNNLVGLKVRKGRGERRARRKGKVEGSWFIVVSRQGLNGIFVV